MQMYRTKTNAARRCSPSYAEGTDDIGFTEAILDHLTATFRMDTTRLVATGLSRGGFFTQRLAAERSHRLPAIASVGAPLPMPVQEAHAPWWPRAPIGVAGADPFNVGLPIGRTSRDIDLNEIIWRFFAGHRRQ